MAVKWLVGASGELDTEPVGSFVVAALTSVSPAPMSAPANNITPSNLMSAKVCNELRMITLHSDREAVRLLGEV
jgi:hypothetical protein